MKLTLKQHPWGQSKQFCKNKICTVKIITLNKNSALSLQYHNLRDEFWHVISGSAKVVIHNNTIDCKTGDEFFVPRKTKHRIITKEFDVKILELAYGKFEDTDIVRLKDKYARAKYRDI